MSFSARLLRFLCAFILFIAVAPLPAFAQSVQTPFQQSEQTSKQIQVILVGFSGTAICALSGIDIFHPGYNCLGQKIIKDGTTPSSQINTQPLGALGLLTSGIGTVYQKPISGEESIKYLANNFGIAKKTLAQENTSGGFQSFSFLQDMFLIIRNISFLLLVFAFILIGIAIMLRFKIDPRTVMTLQNQIPKIIIGIILITFSFSIAGLLADGMWLVTYFGINTIGGIAQSECGNAGNGNTFAGVGTQQLLNNPVAFTSHVLSDAGCFGAFDGIGGLSKDIGSAMGEGLTSAILEATGLGVTQDSCDTGFLGLGIVTDIGDCIQKGIYSFLSFIIGIVAFLIVLIAIIVALIRLWITLVKAYVYILLDVITAPLQILVGILPGGRMGFSKWFRHITGYLLLFPASAMLIFLALAFALNPGLKDPSPTQVFFPPLIGVPGTSGNLGNLIAFGLIMILPEALEMIKEAMQIKSNSKVSSAIVGGFGRGVGPAQALGGVGSGLFGKDKNGNPQVGRLIAGRIWTNKMGPQSSIGSKRPMSWYYRGKDDYDRRKRDLLSRDKGSIRAAAERYAEHQSSYYNRDRNEAFTEFMNKHYYQRQSSSPQANQATNNTNQHTNETTTGAGGSPAPSTGSHPHGGTSPGGSGGASASGGTAHTPSGASGTSTTGHTSSSPVGSPPVGGATPGASGGSPTPRLKVKWFGNDLKFEDGTGTVFAQKSGASYKVETPTSTGITTKYLSRSDFNRWLSDHNYEEVTS